MKRNRFSLLAVVLLFLPQLSLSALQGRGVTLEDFESGSIVLNSYPDQDNDPTAWELTPSNTYDGSAYALRLYGNTWKTQDIQPYAVNDSTVWQVAAFIDRLGEMQAFGVADSVNELFYTFGGNQLPQETKWWTVYQGAFPTDEWYAYLLPIGQAWFVTYGYYPVITKLLYINDDDSGGSGVILFDEIIDVTEDLPVPPIATIDYTIEHTEKLGNNLYRVALQFFGQVSDPDSESHDFLWDFGDSTTSIDQNPTHEFLVEAYYPYTVGLTVKDPDDLAGFDTCQVNVEVGPAEMPLTVNFVGDIMTARGYESNGGIIDTYGIEALFEPTLSIFGGAADVNVANLEVPYTDRGEPHPTKSVVFRARPENIVGLKYAGIDLVTLGNNHIIDYGEEGMLQTMELLDTLRIRHSGAGINEYFALQPTFWTEKGVRIAFLGQCNRTGRLWNYQPFLDAGYNKCGFGNFITQNIESSINNVRDVADIVILQGHSGTEYQTEPPDKFLGEPPPVEANEIGPDDPDFRFNIEPSAGDRALRRQVIDFGADIMINHHPHVLQGFESYNGKLIAHSLGNFVFELYYPETMPTIVLTLEITKNGIMGYTFTPAWIDDYIPKPAIGQFGREIMDRMAEYSRKMGAIVATDPEISRARIYLSRDDADSTQTDHEATVPFVDLGGYRITPPIEVSSDGNLSEIINAVGSGLTSYEVCWGSEILWHGNFEDEGATFWDDNTSDEWLDASEAHSGQRSLALRRHDYDSAPVGTDLEKNLPCYPEHRHTCAGYLKAENAKDAIIMNRFYSSRTSTTPIISTDIGDRFSGSQDWTFRWQDLETPENAIYFDIRCENDAPSSGTGMAWFDDLKLIQWEPWFTGQTPVSVPSPNNHRFIQIRTTDTAVAEATINYKTTSYNPNPADAPDPMVRISEASWIRNFPNPARGNTTIELRLPQATGPLVVDLAIFDIQGRRVANLFKGRVTGGTPYTYQWDGSDDRGRGLASGVYFSRAVVNGDARSQKILILR